MKSEVVAPGHRGAYLQAGAGIAAPRLGRFTIRARPTFASQVCVPRWGSGFGGGEMKSTSRLAIALLTAFFITGCAARSVRIAELKDQPDRYDDKRVSVTGV